MKTLAPGAASYLWDKAKADEVDAILSKKVIELNEAIYGPKFCQHCQQIRPIKVYELEGSRTYRTDRTEGLRVFIGFTGSLVCSVCCRGIEDKPAQPTETSDTKSLPCSTEQPASEIGTVSLPKEGV